MAVHLLSPNFPDYPSIRTEFSRLPQISPAKYLALHLLVHTYVQTCVHAHVSSHIRPSHHTDASFDANLTYPCAEQSTKNLPSIHPFHSHPNLRWHDSSTTCDHCPVIVQLTATDERFPIRYPTSQTISTRLPIILALELADAWLALRTGQAITDRRQFIVWIQ